ncbi:glycoside hydrolase family 88 protein [Sphingobacterium chuzhouense]|uniref:Glycoside hydrolase family 88 protein n=1 Tax=Sphingobacterium chuzhouense TaxID=1742264 RepID=A0ABR7XNW7_9SPHI|nr:glycoside hydrolase family 88 protein [Sphingobacterium chuzhouense]MBD1420865.1 glycoside hydrolase family 88 protein [Sphingobacterium chuzhouense]
MLKKSFIVSFVACTAMLSSCSSEDNFVKDDFTVAEKQYEMMLNQATDLTNFPRTTNPDGSVKGTDIWDWTQGFFPGGLWYMYEYTQKPEWKAAAEKWTEALEEAKFLTQHHDVGFVMYCSYGNAVRLEKDTAKINKYNKILIQSAESALTRYDEKVGLIKSWNDKMSWDGKTLWTYPVIIDNMMNLELLFYVSKLTGDPKYRNVAISHADKTMTNHFRTDYSTYHVVDYDAKTGEVLHQQTNQGYSDNSTWSRGQGWAIYGYTLMYRETKDPKYLEHAKNVADFFIHHPNLPEDKIPYWDFNVEQHGYTPDWDYKGQNKLDYIPRDASAASLAASAMLELSTYTKEEGKTYFAAAEHILKSLSSEEYLAEPGTNSGFILKHSVGSFPHNNEIDVPLIYADYYFLEALLRYHQLK